MKRGCRTVDATILGFNVLQRLEVSNASMRLNAFNAFVCCVACEFLAPFLALGLASGMLGVAFILTSFLGFSRPSPIPSFCALPALPACWAPT